MVVLFFCIDRIRIESLTMPAFEPATDLNGQNRLVLCLGISCKGIVDAEAVIRVQMENNWMSKF